MSAINPELVEKAADIIYGVLYNHGHNGIDCRPDVGMDLYVTTATRAALEAVAEDMRRDEYHTMDELYEYRMLYNALAANTLAHLAVKSWRHSDGELCFGGGWFVVYLNLPTGQVSNHYRAEHWGLFNVPEVDTAPEYDGHTPAEAAERLRAAARIEARDE